MSRDRSYLEQKNPSIDGKSMSKILYAEPDV